MDRYLHMPRAAFCGGKVVETSQCVYQVLVETSPCEYQVQHLQVVCRNPVEGSLMNPVAVSCNLRRVKLGLLPILLAE